MPSAFGRALPTSASNRSQSFGDRVEHDSVGLARFPKTRTAHGLNRAVLIAKEDAIRVQIRESSGSCEMSTRGIELVSSPVSFAKLVQRFKGSDEEKSRQDPLRMATAAILLEIAYADGTFTPAEDGDVVGYLERAFALHEDEARDLLSQAGELRARTIDHFALTNFIRKNSTLEQRIEIVRTMWRIVYSDRKLTDYEHY